MAIPIYVPEGAGPEQTHAHCRSFDQSSPVKATNPSSSSTTSSSTENSTSALALDLGHSRSTQSPTLNCTSPSSFVHQLARELYNLYIYISQDNSNNSNQSRTRRSVSSVAEPLSDPNNNHMTTTAITDINGNEIRRTRQRHPAGRHGFCSHRDVAPLAGMGLTSSESNISSSRARADPRHYEGLVLFELKVKTSTISIGCTLRKLADSFERFHLKIQGQKLGSAYNSKYELNIIAPWPVFLTGAFISAFGIGAVLFLRR